MSPPSSPPPPRQRSLPDGKPAAEVFSSIGPKPIEEFSDEEVEVLEATAVEVPMRVVVAGDTIAVFRDFKDGPAVKDLPVLPHHHHEPGTWTQAICFMNDCLNRDCYESHVPDPLD